MNPGCCYCHYEHKHTCLRHQFYEWDTSHIEWGLVVCLRYCSDLNRTLECPDFRRRSSLRLPLLTRLYLSTKYRPDFRPRTLNPGCFTCRYYGLNLDRKAMRLLFNSVRGNSYTTKPTKFLGLVKDDNLCYCKVATNPKLKPHHLYGQVIDNEDFYFDTLLRKNSCGECTDYRNVSSLLTLWRMFYSVLLLSIEFVGRKLRGSK